MPARLLNNILAFLLGLLLISSVEIASADTFSITSSFCTLNPVTFTVTASTMADASAQVYAQLPVCGWYDPVTRVTATSYTLNGLDMTVTCVYIDSQGVSSVLPVCKVFTFIQNAINPCVAKAGQTASSGYYDWGSDPTVAHSSSGCASGCQATFSGVFPVKRALVNGVYHYFASGSYTYWSAANAQSCTADPAATGAPLIPADVCASGQTMGIVNGVNTCLTAGGAPVNPYSPPAPKTATTTKNTVDNGNGTTTTTETTSFPDGSTKTTSTTTTTATGATTTTSTSSGGTGGAPRQADTNGQPSDKLTGICESNPTLPICKGDMATESTQKQIKDLLNPDASGIDSTFQSQKDAKTTAYDGLKANIDAVPGTDYGFTWDWSPSLPSAACAPLVMTAAGHTMTMDWCPVVEKLRDILGYVLYIGTAFMLFNIFAESNKAAA